MASRGRASKKWQKSGTFTCSYCPFRSTFNHSLKIHEKHHTVCLGFQCSFCTFSAATDVAVKLHIDRVHSETNKVEFDANHPEIFRDNHEENLTRHANKLFKVMKIMSKEFPPEAAQNTSQQDEESTTRAELIKLTNNMKLAQVVLMATKKSLEEEVGGARAKSDQLRKRIEELETKDRSLSAKKAYLLELKERVQQQITELTTQKNQLEQELMSGDKMEAPATKKTKSDDLRSRSLERIQQERPLSDVKIKLSVIGEEEKELVARIRDVEKELAENVRNLTEMRAELEPLNAGNLATGEPSPISVQLKALKKEQLGRIAEFSRLQKKLFHISCSYVLDDICRIEEKLINFVGDVDEN